MANTLSAPAHAPSVFTLNESALISRALNLLEKKQLKHAPLFSCRTDLENYLRLRFAGLTNEQGHTLFLNTHQRLISAEVEFFGDQKSVAWDLRRTVARAIQLGADSVVVAHNHPGGHPMPSEADFKHLDWLEKSLAPLNITLLDSFVVTATTVQSIKAVQDEHMAIQRAKWSAAHAAAKAERSARYQAARAAKAAKTAQTA